MESPHTDSYQALWNIEMLGSLRASWNGHTLTHFQTQKTAMLLAYLACHLNQRPSREALIDLLWPEAEPEAGRHRLSQALGWLRAQLELSGVPRGSVLSADRQNIGLHSPSVTTDVAAFEAALQAADQAAEADRIPLLQRAVNLYRGEFLPGCYDDWALTERQRLAALFLSALRRLVLHFERQQAWESALACARQGVTVDPLDEDLQYDLIRLLAESGQAALALRQFRAWERVLAKEMGETPSPTVLALIEQIRRTFPPFAPSFSSTAPTTQRAPVNAAASPLPLPLTRFFGRQDEIARVEVLVQKEQARLVTLTGLGGAGKTRLTLEVAARLAASFAGGVWFVPLAELNDARRIPAAIAETLRLSQGSSVSLLNQIVETLTGSPVLLVLDNMEHLIAGGVVFVRDLLTRIPTLTLLITSRQRLGLEGEREIALPPLSMPSGMLLPNAQEMSPEQLLQIDSARLFVDRAQAVRASFEVTSHNAGAIARLCERLEGLPLALELCAAWAQTLTPAQMLAQLAGRFDLLVSRRADIAPRHRTLRATLEYSYLLLPPDLQRLFVRLSVFRGGWTLEAASAFCMEESASADTLPLQALAALTELRERSLILAEEEADGKEDAMRYRMLETLREFATEQQTLAVEAPLRKRHAEYFLQLTKTAGSYMVGPEQLTWLRRLEAEHDNLRAALGWAVEAQAVSIGLRLAIALTPFWDVRGYSVEGQDWLERLLELTAWERTDREAISVRAEALNACGRLARSRARFAEGVAFVEEALQLWREIGNARGMATSLQYLATVAYSREHYDEARAFLREALSLARELGSPSLVATALFSLGNIAMEQREWSEACALFEESLQQRRSEGNLKGIGDALNNQGLVARYRNDLATARTLLEESLVICRELSDISGIAITLLNLGTVMRLEGGFAEARSALSEATALAIRVDNQRALAWCVRELGHLACAEADYATGVRLLGAAEALRHALGMSFNPADPDELAQSLDQARIALGEAAFFAAWPPEENLSLEEACGRAVRMLPVM